MTDHPALAPGRVAVITGAGSGIGRATALRLAGRGLRVCLADLASPVLDQAATAAAAASPDGADAILSVPTDVSDVAQLQALCESVYAAFGEVAVQKSRRIC